MKAIDNIISESVQLLRELIRCQSFSREEGNAAELIRRFCTVNDMAFESRGHNTWCYNKYYQEELPTILLNSHIDTVKPSDGWTRDPFGAEMENSCLYGLGSNDAGASLVSLFAAFRYFQHKENLPFNICMAATAEEEISGQEGIASISDIANACTFGIVGEPTTLEMGTAERGLMVLDAHTRGKTGHAARSEGINALYLAVEDIQWIREYDFERKNPYLGGIQMSVTMASAGIQHNVVPDSCHYVIDIRTVDTYSYKEILETLRKNLHATIQPRSERLKPSSIAMDHELVRAGLDIGLKAFGSSTLSDQALLSIPTIKLGPGESARSHTPDEFIHTTEIEEGIKTYIRLLAKILNTGGQTLG